MTRLTRALYDTGIVVGATILIGLVAGGGMLAWICFAQRWPSPWSTVAQVAPLVVLILVCLFVGIYRDTEDQP